MASLVRRPLPSAEVSGHIVLSWAWMDTDTPCLCSWGFQVLCEATKDFESRHIVGDSVRQLSEALLQITALQLSTWSLRSVPGFKS
jgi:hypothetical protein